MTFQSFPISDQRGVPAYYSDCLHLQRNGVFYQGEHVSFMARNYGADTCTVRDYHGNVVSVTPLQTATTGGWGGIVQQTRYERGVRYALHVSPLAPAGGWKPGWYRAYLTGASSDPSYGNSYGVTNFCVIRPDANFPRLPVSRGGYWGGYIPSGSGDTDTEADSGTGQNFGIPAEMITRACLGIGVSRLTITQANDPDEPWPDGWDTITGHAKMMENVANVWWLDGAYVDPIRTRYQWLAFAYQSVDLTGPVGEPPYDWQHWLNFFVKDETIDGTQVFIEVTTGSLSGYKCTIRYPDAGTVVETYDNVVDQWALEAAINASSAYVQTFAENILSPVDLPFGPTAIGDVYRQGVIDTVATLYPLGITRFEGPLNEPTMSPSGFGASWPHQMRLFQAAVHAGNANAKAIGPCTVNITRSLVEPFFAAGIGDYLDEISVHDYNNVVNGDINLGRTQIEDFLDVLEEYGQSAKLVWQTEANHVKAQDIFGVYHPRRTRVLMARTLLWEQYGVPFERNPYWYDWSVGFWSYAAFMWMNYSGDKSTNPAGVTLCVLAQETYGKNFHHRIDFGAISANNIFVGNVYGSADTGSVAAIVAGSYIPDASVTLTVTGSAGPITVVSGLGEETSVALTSGRITVAVEDIPTYIRLPAGANMSVYSVNDWGPTPNPNVTVLKKSASIGGVDRGGIADGLFMQEYVGGTNSVGIYHSSNELPDAATVMFYDTMTVDRVIIWNGPCWQEMPGLLDYDIDTWNGSTWTTRKTVTKNADSFQHGADFRNTGTERETFWDEQWIEDVTLDTPIACDGIRVYVREASYGGEPDALMINDGTYDLSANGMAVPKLAIQEIAVLSETTPTLPSAYSVEVLADSPVGYWRLGEPSGTTATSQVNSPTVDGTYTNAPQLGIPGAVAGDTAMDCLDSGEKYVSVPDHSSFWFGDTFSLEFWEKPDVVGYGGYTVAHGLTNSWAVFRDNTTNQWVFAKANGNDIICKSTVSASIGEWAHVVVTKNGGVSSNIYVNGVDVTGTVTNQTLSDIANGAELIQIGSFLRSVDEVAIYPTVLSQSRVEAHYRAGTAPGIPENTKAPVVEGTADIGTQLACQHGRWIYRPSVYTYQWQNSANGTTGWANINGETRSDYIIDASQSNQYLRCGVIGSNPGGSSQAVYSNAVGPVS